MLLKYAPPPHEEPLAASNALRARICFETDQCLGLCTYRASYWPSVYICMKAETAFKALKGAFGPTKTGSLCHTIVAGFVPVLAIHTVWQKLTPSCEPQVRTQTLRL